MNSAVTQSAVLRVSQLASTPRVHRAFQWFHLQQQQLMEWQRDLVSIAAPPFGERERADWLAARFGDLKLDPVEIDSEGNVLGWRRGSERGRGAGEPGSCIVLSAHIDTVFPRGVAIDPVIHQRRLTAPGACDNGAGVTAMLAVCAALEYAQVETAQDLLFVGNVGEEGEGDLRGIRYLYRTIPERRRISSHVVLDGAGNDAVVTRALGSLRYRVTIEGPGGHSWTDSARPNPIVVMSRAIEALNRIPLPHSPRTTLNVGLFEGGSGINSIPERAAASFDLRSLDEGELLRLEVALFRAVEDAVLAANRSSPSNPSRVDAPLRFSIERIGHRPAGRLDRSGTGAQLFEAIRAVDRHMGIRSEERTASTDANVPLSLDIPAVSIGAGGEGGGVHTRAEWYDATNRELGLKRILLLLLSLD